VGKEFHHSESETMIGSTESGPAINHIILWGSEWEEINFVTHALQTK
jgi:hypothetical protein